MKRSRSAAAVVAVANCTSFPAAAAVDAQRPVAQHSIVAAAAADAVDVAAGGFVEGGRRVDSAAIWHSATPVEVETGLDCCNSRTGDLCRS